jgi:large subunit ribosomal protein L18
MANKSKIKVQSRLKRKSRLRNKIKGTPEKPRLTVYRSVKQIYVQLNDDMNGKCLTGMSSLSKSLQDKIGDAKKKGKTEVSKLVGKAIAEKAKEMKIERVVFDRNGFIFHGRIKAVADGAREGGLKF